MTYYEIKYRVDDPDKAAEWEGEKTANVTAPTAEEAVEKLRDAFRMFRLEIAGDPVRREMTDDEYENG